MAEAEVVKHSRPAAGRAKNLVIKHVSEGFTVLQAMTKVGYSDQTYLYWRKHDPEFKAAIDRIRNGRVEGRAEENIQFDFPEFCEQFLGQRLFSHQLQWVDLLEGRVPRNLHPAMTYLPSRPELLICNTPPEHAKSTTLTVNYVTYRIVSDPNVRIIICSATKEMANKFLYAVKNRLTHPRYAKLQGRFGPQDGFARTADSWTADKVYLGGEQRDSGEKDPTVLSLGMGGQIYGARADLIILDDCIVKKNVNEFEKQIEWISQEVLTRLSDEGKLLIVGTRVGSQDLYSELLNSERWPEAETPYTYFAQPAVLDFAEDAKDWVTLWPKSNQALSAKQTPDPVTGLYTKWDGASLARRRAAVPPRTWAMVYQQQQVAEDAVFPAEAVRGAVNGQRQPGPLLPGAVGHPRDGLDHKYVVAGLDPAASGYTAAVVMAVDRNNRKRYVMDIYNKAGTTPLGMRQMMMEWTERFGIQEWRVEKNAMQVMLTQDQWLRDWLAGRGCLLTPHFTNANKWDEDFGVASLAPLFEQGLIELPSTKQMESCRRLIDQLITWQPQEGKRSKTPGQTDIVMALWFAEIRAREITEVNTLFTRKFMPNEFLSRGQRAKRFSVNLDEAWLSQSKGRFAPTLGPL